MRLFLTATLLAALTLPAAAQPPVSGHAGFTLAVDACARIVEEEGGSSARARAIGAAGLAVGQPDPAQLQSFFFKDAQRVDWWRRPVSTGTVQVGYDPAANKCRVFLMGTPRASVIPDTFAALSDDWFAQDAEKTFVSRMEDGRLLLMTLLPGDESKGVTPLTLTAVALVYVLAPDEGT